MQLSLTHPCFWKLLLLLVSNLLLWEGVASVPTCSMRNGRCYARFEEMLDQAISLSEQISKQAFNMFTEFDSQYSQSHQLIKRNFKKCHTSSIEIPKLGSKTRLPVSLHPLVLLKLVERILGAWKLPLSHLVNNMPSLKDAPATILSKAREIKKMNDGLLEGVRTILSQFQGGNKENENYLGWSGLASLQSEEEDVRLFTFYNLIRCVGRETQKVETAFKIVKCKISKQNEC
ncbi:prolactin-2A1-like [Meriones unguiculatus]|uniref:prolactin-2A1-like n=1 Tax=Meriones unguiculatus TaxID=10047 RepID=UPI000B4FB5D2|nr:prolactin-2A1-like [Meriones unguiculatus]